MAQEYDPRPEAEAHLNPFSSSNSEIPHTPSDHHAASTELHQTAADYDQLHSSGDRARDEPAHFVSEIHATDSGGQHGAGLPASESAGHVGRKEGQEKPKGMTEKVKEVVYQMKDTIIGHKQHHEGGADPRSATAPGATPGTVVDDESGSADRQKVGCLDKVKDMITGQKAGQGSATGKATTDDARTHAEKHPNVTNVTGYVGQPSPAVGIHGTASRPVGTHTTHEEGLLDRIKDKLGGHEHDKQGDVSSIGPTHSAISDNVHGGSIDTARSDGFPRPVHPSEAGTGNRTRKEGLVSKMMSKLHLSSSEKSPTPS